MGFKIYTKVGDNGQTSLFGGQKVPKHHLRVDCYGTVDELNSFLGLLNCKINDLDISREIILIQNELFKIGSFLASSEKVKSSSLPLWQEDSVLRLESKIDEWESTLEPLKNFILPGGSEQAATAHVARVVCRRAERLVTALNVQETVEDFILPYLNRLSDFLFVMARKLNQNAGLDDIKWSH